MRVESVNIGQRARKVWQGQEVFSAIDKAPVHGWVQLGLLGFEGDEQADAEHGGADRAVFIMPVENYRRFHIDAPYGFLGENLTISGIDAEQVTIGSRLRVGSALLEVSQPHMPCWRLAEQVAALPHWKTAGEFVKSYCESGHVGFYCRVLKEGLVKKGDGVSLFAAPQDQRPTFETVTVRNLCLARVHPQHPKSRALLQAAVQTEALSQSWKEEIAEQLALNQ